MIVVIDVNSVIITVLVILGTTIITLIGIDVGGDKGGREDGNLGATGENNLVALTGLGGGGDFRKIRF